MSLLEQCQQLRSAIEAQTVRRAAYQNSQVYRQRAQELLHRHDELITALSRILVLKNNNVAKFKAPAYAGVRNSLGKYRQRVIEDPERFGVI